ncbi:hypothetical protein SCP_0311180 [Sparassis crispa]|uniref:F-box domain-containing protein n=1 Tax=Sparassis crispa TaxID=139825 RepID=A0A401GGT9_9APHY|nr:hypothetical protein SCP_0311180 [Sparassis crispa]GBE81389.1 hypothetical protein SCP_0311180 [Sparassis crispa]
MSKHSLSPAPLPPSKRQHVQGPSHSNHSSRSNFDALLYDEIVLVIFSYLSWTDLCAIQSTNRNWSRLALDNQLWKALYLGEYGRTRLRGVRGFIGRGDGREVRPLPGRAKSEEVKDWKWMFRISSNWRTGRCSVEALDTDVQHSLSRVSVPPREQTHILLAGNVTIFASSQTSSAPPIVLTAPTHHTHTMHCRSSVQTQITALALDQSPPHSTQHIRLLSFLSTGEFSLFSVDHRTPSHSSRLLTYVPAARSARTSPISQAVYHHPLLVTLSQSFHLSLYDLSSNSVSHMQTLTSFTSYPPSSLVLSTLVSGDYKLVLAYAIPVFPAHWSVGATELIISSTSLTVASTRTARATDVPQGWVDESKLQAMREQWSRKVARVADTQTDGKWVVLAPADPAATASVTTGSSLPASPSTYASSGMHSASSLQLYRLSFPASLSATALPKLTFVRTLHGQIGPVSALALADGRCVSLGVNGSIWVWDLEGGTGAEVFGSAVCTGKAEVSEDRLKRLDARKTVKGTVVFDERRILSADGDGVHVWRFDV